MEAIKRLAVVCGVLVLFLVHIAFAAALEEADDFEVYGLELEKLLNLGSGLLATGLFIVTMLAYTRTKRQRLLYVGGAFFLFAVKSFLMSSELFFGEWLWVDPTASALNFAVLLSFFIGLTKK